MTDKNSVANRLGCFYFVISTRFFLFITVDWIIFAHNQSLLAKKVEIMEVYTMLLFVIMAALLIRLMTKCQISYLRKNPVDKPPSQMVMITSCIVFTLITFGLYYFLCRHDICTVIYAVISVLLTLILALLTLKKTPGCKEWSKTMRLNHIFVILALCSPLNVGVIFFCQWFFPDVTSIRTEQGKYEVTTRNAIPLFKNFMPTGSYIENHTEDTLYRVVVSYAFLGEEIHNHYNITDTIAPQTTAGIPCPPNYVLRRIYPIMMPSSGRMGRTRTRRSYIVTKSELDAFTSGDFGDLGIKDNIRVNSFNITTNPIIWEDPERLRILEQTIDRFSQHKK